MPDALPGFELSSAQRQLMADVWPASEDTANAVRVNVSVIVCIYGRTDASSLSVH